MLLSRFLDEDVLVCPLRNSILQTDDDCGGCVCWYQEPYNSDGWCNCEEPFSTRIEHDCILENGFSLHDALAFAMCGGDEEQFFPDYSSEEEEE